MRKPKIRALVCISDLHVGSTEAILHPDFVTEKGQVLERAEREGRATSEILPVVHGGQVRRIRYYRLKAR